jgi:NADPH2:quinone reductase
MHAWFCDTPTGPEALTWREAPTPEPQAHELRLRIAAASLNFPDLLIVRNQYQHKPALPFVPGAEMAGWVEAVGADVRDWQVGQAVACLPGVGGFGTHACVSADLCLPLPEGFPMPEAAALIMTYATTHHALVDRGQLRAGETLLVLGAAGGVGSAAIQVAKTLGARVVAAAGGQAKCQRCTDWGADATIDYNVHTPEGTWREEIKRLTQGQGVDVVYDAIGGAWAEPTFRSMAWRGRYLVIGFAAGDIPRLPLNLPLLKGASLVGVFWGDYARREPQANRAMLETLVRWHGEGKIAPVVGTTLPMTQLKEAYERMQQRQVVGKLVLVND